MLAILLDWLTAAAIFVGCAVAMGLFMAIAAAVLGMCVSIVDRFTGWY